MITTQDEALSAIAILTASYMDRSDEQRTAFRSGMAVAMGYMKAMVENGATFEEAARYTLDDLASKVEM